MERAEDMKSHKRLQIFIQDRNTTVRHAFQSFVLLVRKGLLTNKIQCLQKIQPRHHHHHHKHQVLGHLARSVSRVTAGLANVSSVSRLFSFLVDCIGMIWKGFGCVATESLSKHTTFLYQLFYSVQKIQKVLGSNSVTEEGTLILPKRRCLSVDTASHPKRRVTNTALIPSNVKYLYVHYQIVFYIFLTKDPSKVLVKGKPSPLSEQIMLLC